MSKLFATDPRAHQLDVEVRAQCHRDGIRNEGMILQAQARARAEHQALWAENPTMTVQVDRDLRAARKLPAKSAPDNEKEAELLLRQSTTPIYGGLAATRQAIAAVKACAHKSPALAAMLKTTQAGNSAPVLHALLTEHAESEAIRRPTAPKSFRK